MPEQYFTIQSAIDASSDGDEILVSSGTYYENINFNGKDIALIGEDRDNTILDGQNADSVVKFANNETENAKLPAARVYNIA